MASSLLNFLSPLFPTNTTTSSHPKFPTSTPLPSNSLSLNSPKHPQTAQTPITISKKEDNNNNNPSNELMAVVCPSLAFSNTLFFRSAYNVQVLVDENENEERLLNRFRREVMRAGVIQECKRRRYFENKQDKEKRKTREAAKRNSRRRRPFQRGPFQSRDDAAKVEKKEDDDKDNWEMPVDDAPF